MTGNNNATRRCIRQCNSLEAGVNLPNGLSNGGGHHLERSCSVPADTVNLKRRVGLFSGVALIVGTMIGIFFETETCQGLCDLTWSLKYHSRLHLLSFPLSTGSGIFVSPKEVLVRTGSVGMFLMVWLICGFMSLLGKNLISPAKFYTWLNHEAEKQIGSTTGALAYAELGTMNTSSGAEYAYFLDAFGPVPAFLFSWVSTLVLKPSQLAIICLTFAQYSVEAFINDPAPESTVKLVCLATIGKSPATIFESFRLPHSLLSRACIPNSLHVYCFSTLSSSDVIS